MQQGKVRWVKNRPLLDLVVDATGNELHIRRRDGEAAGHDAIKPGLADSVLVGEGHRAVRPHQ